MLFLTAGFRTINYFSAYALKKRLKILMAVLNIELLKKL